MSSLAHFQINLNAALSEERSKTPRSGEIVALPPPTPKKEDREKELTSMIHDMENKHGKIFSDDYATLIARITPHFNCPVLIGL